MFNSNCNFVNHIEIWTQLDMYSSKTTKQIKTPVTQLFVPQGCLNMLYLRFFHKIICVVKAIRKHILLTFHKTVIVWCSIIISVWYELCF